MNYNYIVNPLTNRKCYIDSRNGQRILKNYINQNGGGICNLCKSPGTKSTTCPLNEEAIQSGRVNFARHPKAVISSAEKKRILDIKEKLSKVADKPKVSHTKYETQVKTESQKRREYRQQEQERYKAKLSVEETTYKHSSELQRQLLQLEEEDRKKRVETEKRIKEEKALKELHEKKIQELKAKTEQQQKRALAAKDKLKRLQEEAKEREVQKQQQQQQKIKEQQAKVKEEQEKQEAIEAEKAMIMAQKAKADKAEAERRAKLSIYEKHSEDVDLIFQRIRVLICSPKSSDYKNVDIQESSVYTPNKDEVNSFFVKFSPKIIPELVSCINKLIDISRDYYEVFSVGNPLGLVYGNLYFDYILSKILMICDEELYLEQICQRRNPVLYEGSISSRTDDHSTDMKRKNIYDATPETIATARREIPWIETHRWAEVYDHDQVARKEVCVINKQTHSEYHNKASLNKKSWASPHCSRGQLYWSNLSFNDSRKRVLKELYDIKIEFGYNLLKQVTNNQALLGISHQQKNKNIKKLDNIFTIPSKTVITSWEDLEDNIFSLDEETRWNWKEIKQHGNMNTRKIGELLQTIINLFAPYHVNGLGLYKYINLGSFIKNYGAEPPAFLTEAAYNNCKNEIDNNNFYVKNFKSCSCICNSLLFLSSLLLTGYDATCLIARHEGKPGLLNEGRGTHWAVECKDNVGDLEESEESCPFYDIPGMIQVEKSCINQKRTYKRYTSDIVFYLIQNIHDKNMNKRSILMPEASSDLAPAIDALKKTIYINNCLLKIAYDLRDKHNKFIDEEACTLFVKS